MAFLNTSEKDQINQKIIEMERGTSGEIVTIIAQRSDRYDYIPLLYAAIFSLVLPLCLYFILPFMENDGWNYHFFNEIGNYATFQITLFVVFSVIVRIGAVKMFLVPDYVKHDRATRNAYMQFFSHDVHATAHGGGILIFVSVAERHVEIIADQRINSKVSPEEWQKIVDQFISQVKDKKICEGFIGAIEKCGMLLHEHYPDDGSSENELHDHLIEI